MSNKNNFIIAENPFAGLNQTDVKLYFMLKSHKDVLWVASVLDADGSFVAENEMLAESMLKATRTISRSIKKLCEAGLINLKYIPKKEGLTRKIFIKYD